MQPVQVESRVGGRGSVAHDRARRDVGDRVGAGGVGSHGVVVRKARTLVGARPSKDRVAPRQNGGDDDLEALRVSVLNQFCDPGVQYRSRCALRQIVGSGLDDEPIGAGIGIVAL